MYLIPWPDEVLHRNMCSGFLKLNTSSVCCPCSYRSQIYHCQPQPWVNCHTGNRARLQESWQMRIVRVIKWRRQEQLILHENEPIFQHRETGFWREVDESHGVPGFPWHTDGLPMTLLSKATLKLAGRNPWPAWGRESSHWGYWSWSANEAFGRHGI